MLRHECLALFAVERTITMMKDSIVGSELKHVAGARIISFASIGPGSCGGRSDSPCLEEP